MSGKLERPFQKHSPEGLCLIFGRNRLEWNLFGLPCFGISMESRLQLKEALSWDDLAASEFLRVLQYF
jgi:hypothetical protein